ncbi:unnamed protein product [Arctia plantaginis]|uniref:Uncharacterized protein n=1 Tax=Arctia plantaginis TaxID=874455 RepID=A0A8S1B815_ARCPL|nr:unnamed protein product [Arctia plantaginis]CAB3254802.1 unnamed protein product [Arctia plantaginis]
MIQRAEKVASGRSRSDSCGTRVPDVTHGARTSAASLRAHVPAARAVVPPPAASLSLHLCAPRFSRACLCRRDAAPFPRARRRRRR